MNYLYIHEFINDIYFENSLSIIKYLFPIPNKFNQSFLYMDLH